MEIVEILVVNDSIGKIKVHVNYIYGEFLPLLVCPIVAMLCSINRYA